MKHRLEYTHMLIPKIVDTNGNSVARAPDSSSHSKEHLERIIACLRALDKFSTQEINDNEFFVK